MKVLEERRVGVRVEGIECQNNVTCSTRVGVGVHRVGVHRVGVRENRLCGVGLCGCRSTWS